MEERLGTAMDVNSEAHTWWEKSASMIITKSPVTKFKPWIYAVLCHYSIMVSRRYNKAYPKPSFPARGLRIYMFYILARHCSAAIEIKTDNFIFSVHLCQLLRYLLGPIRTSVIDYNDLPIQLSSHKWVPKRQGSNGNTYCSLKVFTNSQIMTGKLLRSL